MFIELYREEKHMSIFSRIVVMEDYLQKPIFLVVLQCEKEYSPIAQWQSASLWHINIPLQFMRESRSLQW
jgi:hypothetical protein